MRCIKTEAGQQAFKLRSTELSGRQRSAFLLFDGHRTLADVLKSTEGLGILASDIDDMLAKGFIQELSASHAAPPAHPSVAAPAPTLVEPSAAPDSRTNNERYTQAYHLATQLTAKLGLRGFRLNLAVEAAQGREDLIALLPKLTDALGAEAVRPLKEALGTH